MKSIATILNTSLLIIGSVLAQNSAICQPTISTTPTSLAFSPTQTSGSYKLTMSGAAEYFLTITAPSGFQFSAPGDGGIYHTTRTFDMLPGSWTWTVNVQYTPTTSNASDSITNTLVLGGATVHAYVLVVGDPLPIQLASFKTVSVSNNGVSVNWTTISESNNYGFYVQRNCADIAFIPGQGTTLQQHTYSYIDNPSPGLYQYRLRQVDLDGTSSFSESDAITVSTKNVPKVFALSQNYPNPFNPSTTIRYELPQASPVLLAAYNMLGEKVETLVQIQQEAGIYEVTFDASALSSGVYYYRLQAGSYAATRKLLVLR